MVRELIFGQEYFIEHIRGEGLLYLLLDTSLYFFSDSETSHARKLSSHVHFLRNLIFMLHIKVDNYVSLTLADGRELFVQICLEQVDSILLS